QVSSMQSAMLRAACMPERIPVMLRRRSRSLDDACQLFCLKFLLQRPYDRVQVAAHDMRQLVQRQVDAVIGNPPLREVVRANALGAIARTDLELARLRFLALALFALGRHESGLEQRHRPRAILVLRALILAFHHDPGGQVRDADRRVGLVHVLTARTGGSERVDAQVGGIKFNRLDFVELGQDRNRASGGVNASLRLGGWHALNAMRASFELEAPERSLADDAADDLLIAAVLAGPI